MQIKPTVKNAITDLWWRFLMPIHQATVFDLLYNGLSILIQKQPNSLKKVFLHFIKSVAETSLSLQKI